LSADRKSKRLQETRPDYDSLGGSLTYNSISLEDALSDYWARTPFSSFSVTSQSTEQVATNSNIQNADSTTEWNDIVTIGDTDPVEVTTGTLAALQSCFTTEAEDATTNTATVVSGISDYSGGEGMRFDSVGETATYDFTLDYDIPADNLDIFFRWGRSSGTGDVPELTFRIDGNDLFSFDAGASSILFYSAKAETAYTGQALSSGSHTLEIEATASGPDPQYIHLYSG
jgi:hypothetical protein